MAAAASLEINRMASGHHAASVTFDAVPGRANLASAQRQPQRCAEAPDCDRQALRGERLCGCCLRAQRDGLVVSWCQAWATAKVRAEHRPAPPLTAENGQRNLQPRVPDGSRASAWDRLFA